MPTGRFSFVGLYRGPTLAFYRWQRARQRSSYAALQLARDLNARVVMRAPSKSGRFVSRANPQRARL